MSLLIFSPYFRPHVGGVEAYIEEFLTVCTPARAGVAIAVATTRLPPSAPAHELVGEGVEVWRLPAMEAIPNFPVPKLWTRATWRLLRRAQADRPAVVVSHTRFFVTSLLAWAVARRCGARWVHVEHGSDFVQLDSPLPSLLARAYDHVIGRQILRRADACMAISAAAAAFVRELSGRSVPVVYRGVDRARLEAIPPSAELARLADGRVTVAFIGRLIDGKGVGDLIEAVARLDGERPFCAVVGDGPRRSQLESLARERGLDAEVAFLGYRTEEDVVAIVKAADIVVNPSYTEGLPTAVLLAALCGSAVVATDVGGTREVVEDGTSGLLVPPRDVGALSVQLARAAGDPDLRVRLGAAARDHASQRFDWEPNVDAFLALAGFSPGSEPARRAPAPQAAARGSGDAGRSS